MELSETSQASSTRPSRRGGMRKKPIIEESDDDTADIENRPPSSDITRDEEDIYTPTVKPKQKEKYTTPRIRSSVPPTPFKGQAGDGSPGNENEPNKFNPPLTTKNRATKQPRPPRKSVRTSRKSVTIQTPTTTPKQELPPPATRESTNTDNHSDAVATPPAVNSEYNPSLNSPVAELKSQPFVKSEVPSQPTEKPMDIVVRTRAKAIPQVPEDTTNKARMVITYLILTNFKSYAGRQEVGPFHASFSSVVGPNGSGKSNVIDSLLFVFGFRASKMRQGKISSLIHQSAHHPDLGFCEVQVHFQQVVDQPNGTKEIVPNSDLIVSRKAFKNNSSKYYINNSESNFTAVTGMLRGHGVDLDHKRFLILQGEVESIAQMKPKAANEHDDGLLEYLEDIVGTSKYKTPIEECATETDTLNEVCREKNGRVQHVEKERNALEGKKNAALEHINDENELAEKQSMLWQIFVHECEDNVQVTEEAIAQMQEQLDAETEKHQGAEAEISRLSMQHATEVKQFEALQQNTQAILKKLAKADKEAVKFEEKRNHFNNKLKKLEKSKSTSQAAMSECASNLQRLEDDLARNGSTVLELEQQLQGEEQSLTTIREKLRGKTEGISNEIDIKQKQLSPWQEQIAEKQAAIEVAQSELSILHERNNAGARAITDIEARIGQLSDNKHEKITYAKALKAQVEEAECDAVKTQARLDKVNAREPTVRASLSASRQKAEEARASLASSQSRGNVLDGLMRLKDSGRINGFHGRLGNLGTIEQKYDVAISTACPALDNLVVDTVEVGQQCIDFLRKNNLGRANFILLDRLNQRDLKPIETPEDAPRLFDLVKPKHDKYLPAFYSVLQDSLVAKNLEQANRVAYGAKRWRVVTLDGQLIDKSGTMSGGGTRVAKGAMSARLVQDTSKEQVAKLEVEHEQQEQAFTDFQQEQNDLETSLKVAKDEIPRLQTQISKVQLEVDSIEKNISDAEKRRVELSSSQPVKADGREHNLQEEINGLEKQIADLSENTTDLEADIKALQEKIMEIGGVELRGQKAKVDGLKAQIKTLQEEISGAEVEQAKQEKSRKKNEKGRDDTVTEIEAVSEEIEKFEGGIAKSTQDLAATRKAAEEAQEALETKKEGMESFKTELDQRTTELRETKGVELEMRNRLEENQKTLNENTKRLKYWQEKTSHLVIQSVR